MSNSQFNVLKICKYSGTHIKNLKSIKLVQSLGITGSRHANSLSPRQVLLIDSGVLKRNKLKPGDLRENFVISNLNLLDIKSGTVLQIGSAQIRITFKCEACKHLEKYGARLNKDIIDNRGFLAVVVKSGMVQVGDSVVSRGVLYKEIPEKFSDRLYWVVSKIPKGKVVDYKTLLSLVGASQGYLRVFPTLIKRGIVDKPSLPFYRILNSKYQLLPFIPNQKQILIKDGYKLKQLKKVVWRPTNLYTK